MPTRRSLLRRLKLRTVLLVALLFSGIIPLGISSFLLIQKNQQILRDGEGDYLIRKAGTLSREVSSYLAGVRRQLGHLGHGLLLAPGPQGVADRLREPWVGGRLESFLRETTDLLALQVVDANGLGPVLAPVELSVPARETMTKAFEEAREADGPIYRFVEGDPSGEPLAAIAVPVSVAARRVIVQGLLKFKPLEEVFQNEATQGVSIYLVDREGKLLWSAGGDEATRDALLASTVIPSFVKRPMSLTLEYEARAEGREQEMMLVQVSTIGESGWGLLVQKPLSAAFASVDRMIVNTVLSTLVLVGLSLLFAYWASRWVSQPIQRLADTTHEIASGSFGGRVELQGLSFEFADLAEDFNRMSGHVESSIRQLRGAAQANRDLFIGSLRAFAAAIDAKDPYTRGHSERVAAVSRTIARYLQLPEEVQHKIWIGALLHDVGKIGVEDQILRKAGVLEPDEFEQMKMHTVIGADIMASIEQLREQIPAIRSHHEAWNGKGYPDGLKGEQIPLWARIVAVADTFDAITTNRPYQQAYSLQFAVETITRLTGSRFDAKIVTAFLRAFEAGEIRAGASRPAPAAEPRVAAQG
jgi:putative nucleotidyltransferase with HDIG domain